MNEDKQTLIENFQDKVRDEFYEYQRDLLDQSKDMIFEMSYQTTIKEEIKDLLVSVSSFHSPYELKTLTKVDGILDSIYEDWLKWDSPLSSDLQTSLYNSLGKLLHHKEKEDCER